VTLHNWKIYDNKQNYLDTIYNEPTEVLAVYFYNNFLPKIKGKGKYAIKLEKECNNKKITL
jgi:hypothetical protein